MAIELATPKEHLAGANYVVHHEGKSMTAETIEEAWSLITGWGPYTVTSPVGLDVSEFIPF